MYDSKPLKQAHNLSNAIFNLYHVGSLHLIFLN
jgi:hypothetical protein